MEAQMMVGRRVATISEIERAGDYYGPVVGESGTDERPTVFFLHPRARDEGAIGGQRSVACVATPPHVFRECPDGSLEIRESIAVYWRADTPAVWHGYLDEGHVWRTV
jgi:hypothetical protein